ncbi:hypothetical protein [uncultured Pontibacter sp.]|uniref:toxin-antitoxin system YwqK family antitoxin n=1 Tax=uncultured Pontibacter sp. TaxID=453356 RepID=UPI0026329E89|nr:hypothetical protein [uncultured Pontibacter sp.]
MDLPRIISLFILLNLPLLAFAQETASKKIKADKQGFLFWKVNRFDKHGKFHRRWKVYVDEQLVRNGRFKHGIEVGKWKYYYPNGSLFMVERYNRRNNIILIEKFHENGNIARKGTARIIRTPTQEHYFWFGEWQVYDEQGSLSHTETYRSGKLVSSSKSE